MALGARYAVEAAEQSVNQALARRAEAEAISTGGAGELKAVRARVRELAADLDTVVNTAHGTEIARAEHRLRLAQLAEHALEEFGVEADALVAEYGPEVPVPVIGDEAARRRATSGPRPNAGPPTPSASSTGSARSTRWPWRSTRR